MINNYADPSNGTECTEKREKLDYGPMIKRKCKKCPAIICYRKGMTARKLCADCQDGIPYKAPTTSDYGDDIGVPATDFDFDIGADYEEEYIPPLEKKAKATAPVVIENKDTKCAECGKAITRKSRKQLYCDECVMMRNKRKGAERYKRMKEGTKSDAGKVISICQICGVKIASERKRKFCPPCGIKRNRGMADKRIKLKKELDK